MGHSVGTAGNFEVVASGITLEASVDVGATQVNLTSGGSLVPCTGSMDLFASGIFSAAGGLASLQLATTESGQSSVVLDGGPVGTVTIGNSLPKGTTQTLTMSSTDCEISLCNGDTKGAMQLIKLSGMSQSVEISAGGASASPTIKMTPTGITLSCGPGSSVEITPDGVSIKGLKIQIEADGAATIKGNASAEVSAAGQTTIKGAMVMIN